MKKPPVDELDYLAGVKVVDIGDIRVARGKTRREASACPHKSLIYDQQERRIWCKDCEIDVESFDAFTILVECYSDAVKRLRKDRTELDEAIKFASLRRATKALDEAWRSKNMIPCCPHCKHGLSPDDFANGITGGFVSKEYEKARRDAKKK